MKKKNTLVIAGFFFVAGVVAAALSFILFDPGLPADTQPKTISSPERGQVEVQATASASNDETESPVVSVRKPTNISRFADGGSQTNNDVHPESNTLASRGDNIRNVAQPANQPSEEASFMSDSDYYEPPLPFVFLDLSAVVPATEEAAAAVQKMQRDFMDSTGAATANPADPNFAALWDQFQPTADEQFCAIFGTEACNGLSIEERQKIGHF